MRCKRLFLGKSMIGVCVAAMFIAALGVQGIFETPVRRQAPATQPVAELPATRPAAGTTRAAVGTTRATVAATRAAKLTQDKQVAQAIERGITFLLSQFRNSDLATVPELSDPQR